MTGRTRSISAASRTVSRAKRDSFASSKPAANGAEKSATGWDGWTPCASSDVALADGCDALLPSDSDGSVPSKPVVVGSTPAGRAAAFQELVRFTDGVATIPMPAHGDAKRMLAAHGRILWFGWSRFGLATRTPALHTFSFLMLLYFAVFSVVSARERRWFWSTLPSDVARLAVAQNPFPRGALSWSMCRRINCPRCGKPTFAGCGAHVEQVLGDVPPDRRCRCSESSQRQGQQTADGERPVWAFWKK